MLRCRRPKAWAPPTGWRTIARQKTGQGAGAAGAADAAGPERPAKAPKPHRKTPVHKSAAAMRKRREAPLIALRLGKWQPHRPAQLWNARILDPICATMRTWNDSKTKSASPM